MHKYSTAGLAVTKRKTTAPASTRPQKPLLPMPPTPSPLSVSPPLPLTLFSFPRGMSFAPMPTHHHTFLQIPGTTPSPVTISVSTSAPQRKYIKKVQNNTCRKCGQYRTSETGHSQYKGTIYCPSTETASKEEWLEAIKKIIMVGLGMQLFY